MLRRVILCFVALCFIAAVASAAPAAKWHQFGSWQDNAAKTTESFKVPVKEWRIVWSLRNQDADTPFQIYVYKASGDMLALVDNVERETNGVLYLHESGSFYLKINSSQPYYVTAEADY